MIDVDEVKQKYTRRLYDEPKCKTCEYREERHGHMCDVCPAYQGTLKLYNTKGYDGLRYVGLPLGDKNYIERNTGVVYSDYEVVDRRKRVPFDYRVKFTLQLREHQEKLLADFMKKKYGLIEAPPRTGKTALMVAIGVKLGYKMLVLADQTEFLDQFIWHLEGNEDEGIPKCTNLPELERKHKKKLYGYPKTDEDFENFQFFVSTYQQYASEKSGKDRFRRIARCVGTIAVDEVHSAAAPVFSGVVSKFYSRYRFGVTGTVERKDCFIAGSQVQTPEGQRNIEDLKVGDSVLSFNHESDMVEIKRIIETHRRAPAKTNAPLVRIKHQRGVLVCTADEEFFCSNRNAYVKAIDLTEADEFCIPQDTI